MGDELVHRRALIVSRAFGALSRLALILCEESFCVEAAKFGVGKRLFRDFREVMISNRVFPLIGVILQAIFILVLIACVLTIAFVWRVARDALVYFVLLFVVIIAGRDENSCVLLL